MSISPQCHITSSVRCLSAVLYVLRGYRAARQGFCDFCGRSVVFLWCPVARCTDLSRALCHSLLRERYRVPSRRDCFPAEVTSRSTTCKRV